ncbi:3-ketoacyl-CoA synthase 11-like protein [Cinnamomum micranthum f. kanehirae]|uniref:3-ketoacyl-CoA synthase 11-like protein n=1 Tax=Cinnamomum micranthum f. kanehirae TaxID=337451 RepID=A0A443PC36_9MAGN|nr:3-ketoacyl-CoA synthase 11-like protein [Cinnamomum micranthum f. kanehirae]
MTEPSRKLPDFKQSIKLKYVKLGYHYLITHEMYLFLLPVFVLIAAQLSTFSIQDLHDLWDQLRYSLISVILCSTLLVFLSILYFLTRPPSTSSPAHARFISWTSPATSSMMHANAPDRSSWSDPTARGHEPN